MNNREWELVHDHSRYGPHILVGEPGCDNDGTTRSKVLVAEVSPSHAHFKHSRPWVDALPLPILLTPILATSENKLR
jgi:hypothetical protein